MASICVFVAAQGDEEVLTNTDQHLYGGIRGERFESEKRCLVDNKTQTTKTKKCERFRVCRGHHETIVSIVP